jgi:hypothetical protein
VLMLAEPAQAVTDLALGLVAVMLAIHLRRSPATHRHWRAALWWFGIAALAGAVYHGVIIQWTLPGQVSWAIISVCVVVAVSYLLAATVAEVIGTAGALAFWLLRSVGLVAYIVIAATGHASITAMLACESLTMVSVLALWLWAAYRHHPLAVPVVLAILAGGASGATKALDPDLVQHVGLDPTSLCHLVQIVSIVLLYIAVLEPAWARLPRPWLRDRASPASG